MPREAALTVGQALAGLTAYSKGVRLGIYAPPAERPHEAPPPLPSGVKNVRDVHLLGRLVHVAETAAGPRAIAKGELVKPEAVERYLRGKFATRVDAVRAEHRAAGRRLSAGAVKPTRGCTSTSSFGRRCHPTSVVGVRRVCST